MRVLLRKAETRSYYAGPGRWVLDQAQAHDFHYANQALQHALAAGLAGAVELLLTYDSTGGEVVLPVRSRDPVPVTHRWGINE